MERVCIFIDGSNLYHGLKDVCGKASLDFAKFISWLVGSRHLVRTYYHTAAVSHDPAQAKRQQQFLASLKRIPYLEIKLGRLEPRGNTHVEKGIDVAISVDMKIINIEWALCGAHGSSPRRLLLQCGV